jgi:hypothetical protein
MHASPHHLLGGSCRAPFCPDDYFAARAPVAMTTRSAKAINAHQAMLSVSLCHFKMSHIAAEPWRRLI